MRHGWTKISATLKYCILALQYVGEIGLIGVVVGFLSQSKQSPSKLSKNLNLNRKPSCNSLKSFLPKLVRLLVKEFYSVFAMVHPLKTQVGWMYGWTKISATRSEILHSGFTIFRRDRSDRGGGGVLIAIKTVSFEAVKEFKPESEAELQQLEILFAEISTLTGQRILFCFCYGTPIEDPSWIDVFDNFLHEVCDQFDNMAISVDFNLPDILWDSIDSASGVNELAFIGTLNDHLLTCTTQ